MLFFSSAPLLEARPDSFQSLSVSCLEKTCFEKSAVISGETIPLRGVGLYEFVKLNLFTVAFYVPEYAVNMDQILGDVPKRLVIHYNRKFRKGDIISAAERNLEKNPEVNLKNIRPRLDAMYSIFDDVKENDRYELVYQPQSGTCLYFNGRYKGAVSGEDFAKAFFGIWVSEYPLSEDLKEKLVNSHKRSLYENIS